MDSAGSEESHAELQLHTAGALSQLLQTALGSEEGAVICLGR